MSLNPTLNSYLAVLGAQVAADGIATHAGEVLAVAEAALEVAPAAAAVLADVGQPEVTRQRALAVASSAVLNSRAAAESLSTARAATAVTGMELTAA
ncbi:MAG TPA: hypothetical protein VFG96_04885 [Jiangellaceae bacterium]|nr:hypothetical protein [Jiangellaceae bacterium]